MGSNKQSTADFERLKEALFGIYGFQSESDTSQSFAISPSTKGPMVQIENPTDKESILLNKETFDKYIANCVDIIKKKKEPYYTLVKNNLKTVFFPTEVEVDDNYKNKMRERLQLILNKTYYNKNEVLEEVVWIVDEYINESNYAISKEILVWLNEQYKKD